MLSLVLVVPVVVWLTLQASPLTLLLAGQVLVPLSDTWSIGGILVDTTDMVFAGLAVVLVVRARGTPRASIPYFRAWLALGILMCLAYVNAEQNREYVTDPVRLAYQLYRYCWKPILYYPLTAWLVSQRAGFERALVVAVVAADAFSLDAILDGYAGVRASGPFGRGSNALGGALVIPLMIALARLLDERPRGQRWFYGLSALVIVRALIFSGSRGALVGAACGAGLLFLHARRSGLGRTRLRRLALVTFGLLALVTVTRGNPLERPSMQRFLGRDDAGDDSTFRWRLEERWPHFWRKVVDHPWLGVGTDSDPALGKVANTPHNGYLSVAVAHGLPALALFVGLAVAAARDGRRAFRRWGPRWQGMTGITVSAAIVTVLVHNLVDSTINVTFVAQLFWMLAAIGTRLAREPAEATQPVVPAAVARASGSAVALAARRP